MPLWWLLSTVTQPTTQSGVVVLRGSASNKVPGQSMAFVQVAVALCGLISVGVADAAAAIFGVSFGRHKYGDD